MPPKCPLRSRRPSATAIDAAASGESRRKRARSDKRKTMPEGPEPQGPISPVPAPQGTSPQGPAPQGTAPQGAAPQGTAPQGTAPQGTASQGAAPQVSLLPAGQDVAFPPGLLETLVARVADEVTKRLTPVYTPAATNLEVPPPPEVPLIPATEGSLEEVPIMENVSNLVNRSLTSVQSALSGEPNPVMHKALPEHLFSSPSLAIDSRVSAKLRSKIWNNEYFEFSALLSNPVFENKYQLTVNNSDKGLVPSLCLEPVSKTKKFLSIDSWLNCFHIFVGVYTRKYPNEAPALMKYGEVVQDLAARGHNWKFYDENFRFLRQSQPAAFPWINIHWELWMRSQQPSASKTTATAPHNQSRPRDGSIPKGYCFKFSKGVKCFGCAYKHLCYKCDGSHQPKLCNFRAKSKASNTDSQPAKSQPNKAPPAKA